MTYSDPGSIALHYDKIMWNEIQDCAGEIFDTASRDASLEALIEDALFDRDDISDEMDDVRSVFKAIDDCL